MKHNLSRRTLLTTAVFSGLIASTPLQAGFLDDAWSAVTGHAEDLQNRVFGEEMMIDGETVKEGIFDVTADGQDAAHWATGTASVVILDGKKYIQLGEDFNSGPLPDGYVYYSIDVDINNESDFNNTRQVEAGKLKLGKGASYYEIPADAVVNSVTVWCKRFGAYIGSADLGATMGS